ncbi:hypothetical protein ACFXTH_015148 [Malus domestica]
MAQRAEKEETEFKVPETLTHCINNCASPVIPPPTTCAKVLQRRHHLIVVFVRGDFKVFCGEKSEIYLIL